MLLNMVVKLVRKKYANKVNKYKRIQKLRKLSHRARIYSAFLLIIEYHRSTFICCKNISLPIWLSFQSFCQHN